MAQREVERLIGRLITDEEFRVEFDADPRRALLVLVERGVNLTPAEVAALIATARTVWEQAARGIDPRLQKVRLRGRRPVHAEGEADNGVE
jgi:hypothetical protein